MSTINSIGGPQATSSVGKMSLETEVMLVLSEKNQIFESQVMDRIKEMRDKNNKLKQLGEMAAMVTTRQKEFSGTAKSSDKIKKWGDAKEWETRRTELMNNQTPFDGDKARKVVADSNWSAETKARVLQDIQIAELARDFGINSGDNANPIAFAVNDMNLGAVETLQAQIKSQTDALGNETQLDQIGLQSSMNKAQNTAQLLSTMIKKFDDLHASINRNI